MQTGQIVQLWAKFAINVDVKTTLKMFVVESHGHKTSVNELRQGLTSMSNSTKSVCNSTKSVNDNLSKMVPKQVVDIIDVINQNQSSGKNLRRSLELRYSKYYIMGSAPGRCLFCYTDFL